jgi:hypothetical protein
MLAPRLSVLALGIRFETGVVFADQSAMVRRPFQLSVAIGEGRIEGPSHG